MISKEILDGTLQIFARMATPEADKNIRRRFVRDFLDNQLNQIGVNKWLQEFDKQYMIVQEERAARGKKREQRRMDKDLPKSIDKEVKPMARFNHERFRIVEILEKISGDLPLELKILIIVELFEFCRNESPQITVFQHDVIHGVANIINIEPEEVILIEKFVYSDFGSPLDLPHILILDNIDKSDLSSGLHINDNSIEGQIWFLHIPSIASCYIKYKGISDLSLQGQFIQQGKVYQFTRGSFIVIKKETESKIYFSDINYYFRSRTFNSRILYEVKDIEYVFTTGDIGLNQMSFSEVSGKIVGIMGASGSGKSTLLKILNGSNKPSKGSVTINGISIHENRESIKGLIGFVPQEDLLIEDLTVFDNLYFNAKLCFDNLTNDEIIGKVDETLRNVGLFERKWEKVGTILNPIISGGQRKRLNIALELIRKPEVLFLDEPTSGLSSNDSANILDLLTDLSKEGKLVFVVIHQPSDEIFRMFDKLIILDSSGTYYSDDKEEAKDSEKIIHTENNVKEEETKTSDKSLITVPAYESIEIETAEEIVGTVKNKYQGGYMIYCGHPLDAIEHFKRLSNTVNYSENECYVCHNVDPNHIFSLVEARILGNDGQPSAMRKTLPNQWNASFKKVDQPDNTARSLTDTFIPHVDFMVPGKIKQTIIFIWRDIKTKISDSQYIIITLLEAPVLAFLLSFLIKYFVRDDQESGYIFMNNKNLPVYLFMSVIVAVFMGMIISADEIIKNKKLLKRESFLNLSWGSFLISKVFVLFLISGIQTLLFVLVGNSMMEIKGMMLKYWLVLFSCWGSSVLIGLLISDSFKSVATIYIVVPFLVIPQILLSGIIVKYDNLNPIVSTPVSIPFYGEMITARWGFEALAVNQFVHNDFEEKVYKFDKVLSKARYIKIYWHNMIRGKLDKVENAFNNGLINSEFEKNLEVIRNEFENDITDGSFPKFELTDSLYPDRITSQIIVSAIEYVENLERNYNFFDNEISKKKEYVLNKIDLKDKNALSNLKMTYFNTSLEELVTNSKELTNRIIEYKGRLYQKYDQIYQDPSGKFLKAQFYTPTKQLFGYYIDTYYMNIVIIWFMTALIYIALYFRILRRILDYLEGHSKKKLDKGLKI